MKITVHQIDHEPNGADHFVVVTCDVEGVNDGVRWYIPHGALETRKLYYGLETHEESIDACLREMGFTHSQGDWPEGWTPPNAAKPPKKLRPEGKDQHRRLGGTHSKIEIEHKPGVAAQRKAVLDTLGPHLQRFREDRGIDGNTERTG